MELPMVVSMSFGRRSLSLALAAGLATLACAAPAAAAPSPKARVTVAAVVQGLVQADTSKEARDKVVAYLSGLVEGFAAAERARLAAGEKPFLCQDISGSLSAQELIAAFQKAAPDTATWTQTEAAPVIVDHLVEKYGCH
ncbi:hypothetical protein L0F51_17635 [Afifella sp. H1R]|uniref:hypothetical protein n=1 Tax=Afifella sp. H1R TaxID=2908841 RepID=UPI001F45E884|nr:hypothetical protein [Afifella sp. H1R]MCF1505577.1 hypothetical protein [Afifella sp. H1R]